MDAYARSLSPSNPLAATKYASDILSGKYRPPPHIPLYPQWPQPDFCGLAIARGSSKFGQDTSVLSEMMAWRPKLGHDDDDIDGQLMILHALVQRANRSPSLRSAVDPSTLRQVLFSGLTVSTKRSIEYAALATARMEWEMKNLAGKEVGCYPVEGSFDHLCAEMRSRQA